MRTLHRHGGLAALAGASAALLLAAGALAGGLPGRGAVGGWLDHTGDSAPGLRWPLIAIVVALTAAHYVAAAIAAGAAAGAAGAHPQRAELLLVQLGAATANRLTPAGLGGSAVLTRYLTRRAGLPLTAALGAVCGLTLFGALADLGTLAGLASVGGWLGLPGGAHELTVLATRILTLLGQWPVQLAAGLLALAAVGATLRWGAGRRRLGRARAGTDPAERRWAGRVRDLLHPAAALLTRPRALGTVLLASAATTLVLAAAFALTCYAVPGAHPLSPGALVCGYLVAAAATGVLPLPAGVGTTEAALTALLVTGGVGVGRAAGTVLLFRVLTFWLPAVAGLPALRHLRHSAAL